MRLSIPSAIFACIASVTAKAVQIDNTDASITYTGDFSNTWKSEDSYQGSAVGSSSGGIASFNFTGTKLQYLAPRFAFTINTLISIDGKATTVDLQDRTVAAVEGTGPGQIVSGTGASPVFTSKTLEDKEHTVVVSQAPGGKWTVVDSFVYTTNADPSTGWSLPAESTAPVDNGSPALQKGTTTVKNVIIIALSVSVAAIIIVCVALLFCVRRIRDVQERERKEAEAKRLAQAEETAAGAQELPYARDDKN